MSNLPEVWLRGPIEGVPWQLQPIAHALLQAVEDVDRLMEGWPEALLWTRPGGVASAGFHLQHLTGVVDRLFTYARGEGLSEEQRAWLRSEGQPGDSGATTEQLVRHFHDQVDAALAQLRETPPAILAERRDVGRARLPSTVLGLLSHAAEHSQRHVGQLLVTTRLLREDAEKG